jgi:endonuclease/exonuclease/phosphatase family metal-dependent hydrolase
LPPIIARWETVGFQFEQLSLKHFQIVRQEKPMLLFRMGLIVLWLSVLLSDRVAVGADPQRSIRVMSFNIRYGTARDGSNHWDLRKEFVVKTIEAFNPDLLGTQETLGFQRDYLAEQLAGYEQLGVGRNDGRDDGEMMALFYRKNRFEDLASGHFWLSETPEEVGSKSWDSSLPRMVTWVKLKDRYQPDAKPIACFNTHFDHLGIQARLESARLLRQQAIKLGESSSIIITGDFNTGEQTPPYNALFDPIDKNLAPFVDTFRSVHKVRTEQEGTFSGFRSTAITGARIDWIAVSADWKIMQAGIDRTERNGSTPSDHFPVTAVLER